MSLDKNLNERNGCLIKTNDKYIYLPGAGKTNAYNIDFEKPCFFVNNHYISPILKCCKATLPNPVNLGRLDEIKISIKIPKNIFGIKYGYSLDNFSEELNKEEYNFKGSLRFKSSDRCIDIKRSKENGLSISDYCGWIIITLSYIVGDNTDETQGSIPMEICNLCEISYSIFFNPVKLKVLYGQCYVQDKENIEFTIETCLELTNNNDLT